MRLNHCQIFLFCHIQCSLICETLFNFCYHFFLFLLFLFVLNSVYGKYHNIKYLNITRFLSKCNGSLLEFCFQIYGIKQLWCFNLHYWERERLVGFGLFKPEWQNQQKIFASVYSLLLPVFRDHGQYENNKIIV